MDAFIVEIENRAGQLARIAGALGDAGVNITTGAGLGLSDTGGFGFIAEDEDAARNALRNAAIMFKTVECVIANVADAPGGLATATRKLAGAGVNIQFVMPVVTGGSSMGVAFGVDNAAAARAALGDLAG